MKTAFELVAEFRDAQGKGASRRLRHANKVPAILYGGHRDPRALSLDHTKLLLLLDNERFYSTIINLKVGELNQAAILKDVQRHPAKNAIVHIDLQRVLDDEKIRITIPLRENALACRKIRQLSVAGLLAETMRRIRDEESVSSLYLD